MRGCSQILAHIESLGSAGRAIWRSRLGACVFEQLISKNSKKRSPDANESGRLYGCKTLDPRYLEHDDSN